MHLHSANSSQSHIPQQILDQKAEELRKRKEISDQINVSAHANFSLHRSRGITPGQQAFLWSHAALLMPMRFQCAILSAKSMQAARNTKKLKLLCSLLQKS